MYLLGCDVPRSDRVERCSYDWHSWWAGYDGILGPLSRSTNTDLVDWWSRLSPTPPEICVPCPPHPPSRGPLSLLWPVTRCRDVIVGLAAILRAKPKHRDSPSVAWVIWFMCKGCCSMADLRRHILLNYLLSGLWYNIPTVVWCRVYGTDDGPSLTHRWANTSSIADSPTRMAEKDSPHLMTLTPCPAVHENNDLLTYGGAHSFCVVFWTKRSRKKNNTQAIDLETQLYSVHYTREVHVEAAVYLSSCIGSRGKKEGLLPSSSGGIVLISYSWGEIS